MKIRTWIVGIAALAMSGTQAAAQTDATQWSYDNNVKEVACCDDAGCCGDGCTLDGCCGDGCCDDACCGEGVGCGDACGLEGFTLAGMLGMDCSPITVGGWTQFGYHDNQTPLSTAFDDLLAFNDLQDQVNLHQQYLYVDKAANGSCGNWDWGFRADLLYGTDAQKTQAFGNPGAATRGLGTYDASLDHGYYGWAFPQAYVEADNGDWNIKLGKFYTIAGYEAVTSPSNFFYSHSLTMFNSEPFTHTGILASYKGFDGITLYNGWTAGWDSGFDSSFGGSNYLGGIGYELSDNMTITYIASYGNFGARGGGQDDSYSHSIVLDVQLSKNLNYVAQTDMVGIGPVDDAGNPVLNNDQIGLNQYLFYKWNDRITFGTRMEWWKSDGQSYYETTGGINFKVLNNLVVRPEYRQDWSPANDLDEQTAAIDAILTY